VFEQGQHDEVDATEAERLRGRGAVLLDVREDDEWAVGHAPAAVHVPLGQVGDVVERFRDETVLAICRSGGRSAQAVEVLAAAGVAARNVAGGMQGWAAAGLPVVRDDGSPGAVA